jgi:hypothetical protein
MQGSVAYLAPPPPPKWLTSRLFCSWEVRSFSMAHFGRSVGVGRSCEEFYSACSARYWSHTLLKS